MIEPLSLLRRTDKWYLGNGGPLVYAPPAPQHLRTPGFWDECHFYDHALPRLLCVSFAAELPAGWDGSADTTGVAPVCLVPLDPHLSFWHWQPDRIEARYYLVVREGLGYKQQRGIRVFVNETRQVGPDGTLHCDLEFETLAGLAPTRLHCVAWTVQSRAADSPASGFKLNAELGAVNYKLPTPAVKGGNTAVTELAVEMRGSRKPASMEISAGSPAGVLPELQLTPFWDSLRQGKLAGNAASGAGSSHVYAGLHWKTVLASGRSYRTGVRVNISEASRSQIKKAHAGRSKEATKLKLPNPTRNWRDFFAQVPQFACSEPLFTRYYWYRWYTLHLNTIPAGGNYGAAAIAEGSGPLRCASLQTLGSLLREAKWHKDAALARGLLRNFIALQKKDGSWPARIFASRVDNSVAAPSDIAAALRELLDHHPDPGFASEVYAPLKKLLAYSIRDDGGERPALYGLARLLADLALMVGTRQAFHDFSSLAERMKRGSFEYSRPAQRGLILDAEAGGRTSPLANSHIMECYAGLAAKEPQQYRSAAALYLRRFIELMHNDSPGPPLAATSKVRKGQHSHAGIDLSRPNCFAEYDAVSGAATGSPRIDDVMHGWIADHILKYVCGLRLVGNQLLVDPYPFGLKHFTLKRAYLRGHTVDVCWNTDRAGREQRGYRVYINGRRVHESKGVQAFAVVL